MITLIIYLTCVLAALGAGVLGAWSDFKGLKMANIYTLIVLGTFALAYGALALLGGPAMFFNVLSHIIAALIVFAVTAVMFSFRALGAADSKLATAFALWAGLPGLAPFLFWMAAMGGVLGVAALYVKKRKPFKNPPQDSWVWHLQNGHSKVPYGIAIAFGAILSFIKVGFLDWDSLLLFVSS